MALFIHTASRGVPVAGGGVSPACGVVAATAMVTAAVAAGLVHSSSGSAREENVAGLQEDVISTTQHQGTALQQTSRLLPGGFEFLRLSFAHQPMTLWY
jgi:hypothetical protein